MPLYRLFVAAKERLNSITGKETGDNDLSNDQKLPDALIDLASYEYEHLVQRSLMLLDRYYTTKSDIFLKAIPARLLLTENSIDFFNTIEKDFLELMSFLKPGSSSDEHGVIRGSSVVQKLTNYCWLANEVEGYEPHQINQQIIVSFSKCVAILCLLAYLIFQTLILQVFYQM